MLARIALGAIWAMFATAVWRAVDGLAMYLLVMGFAFAGVMYTLFVFDRDMR